MDVASTAPPEVPPRPEPPIITQQQSTTTTHAHHNGVAEIKQPSVESISDDALPPALPIPIVKPIVACTPEERKERMETVLREFLKREEQLQLTDFIKDFYNIRVVQEHIRGLDDYATQIAINTNHFVRNRYRDILPYDANRVIVRSVDISENPEGYINASHIELPGAATRFIAAQAPLPTTLEDWWHLIDEHNVNLVVMLCKLVEMSKVKCERYWPSKVGQTDIFGDFEITVEKEEKFDDDEEYLLRTLRVENTSKGTTKTVHQLHYTEWPDHGCPAGEHQLLRMIEKMNELHTDKDTPILVHCSAGVGRTGTIISVNYVRELIQATALDCLDIKELVLTLRRQRSSMVQTQDQYQFVHKCVAYYCKQYLGMPLPPPPARNLTESPNGVPMDCCDPPPIAMSESSDDEETTDIPDYPLESASPLGPERVPS